MRDAQAILKRVTSPAFSEITPDVARGILRMKFKSADVQRIHSLSSRAKKGALNQTEQGLLDLYLQIGHMLTLMHSRARLALKPVDQRARRKSA